MSTRNRIITTVDSHTAGECTRLVTSGLPPLRGATMAEKLTFAEQELGWLPGFLLLEPRGHKDMFGAILTPPCSDEADIGVVFMDNQGYEPMCGHAVIGAATTVLETGVVGGEEPETVVLLDTPSGLVRAEASMEDGRVTSVSFVNVPAFVYRTGVALQIPEVGELTIDVVFGGLFFAFVDTRQIPFRLTPSNAGPLADLGMRILSAANEAMEVGHPELPDIDRMIDVRFYGDARSPGVDGRNVVILGDHMVDRSPCGTGTSAETALRHARGQLDVGGSFVTESIIGTRFRGECVAETAVGDFPAVIPRITGRAHITGYHRFVLDRDDPFPNGFRLG